MSYKSTHTGAQIDAGVSAALNPDTTVTPSSTNLVTSGAAAAAQAKATGDAIAAIGANLAPAFDSTATYAVGDLVLYDGKVYRFTATHTGAWDAADVEQTTLGSELTEKANKTDVDANKSSIEYLKLREEEDRQILFGSVVESTEDTYTELASAPIHNSITIGQNTYPRVDNTRLGLETIKGRTVAFNQLQTAAARSFSANGITITQDATGLVTAVASSASGSCQLTMGTVDFKNGHKYLITGYDKPSGVEYYFTSVGVEGTQKIYHCTADATKTSYFYCNGLADGTYKYYPMLIDLTQEYGSTIADFIYAMEQATPDAGVAYVRQRLPLDYYAYNAGELKAPVVSGWSVTDTDEHTTTLSIPSTTLNGVGTAQDYIEAVEVGENDYSLIKTAKMKVINLGDITTWTMADSGVFYAPSAVSDRKANTHAIMSKYNRQYPEASAVGQVENGNWDFQWNATDRVVIHDSNYSDATTFKAALSSANVQLAYEPATPTQSTIAEHLTLAEVSAIAENGGIIGIVNANGDIVQPDLTVDTVTGAGLIDTISNIVNSAITAAIGGSY